MGAENSHGQSSYRKSCPISFVYDVAAVETGWRTWLQGENPVCFTGSRVDLLLDEPECRFRLQPLQRWKEALDPERWRHTGAWAGGWWGSWGPSGSGGAMTRMPRLDTDPVVQGEGYRYLKRRMIFRTVGAG